MYGPKGVGVLWVRSRPRRVRLEPQIEGGGQEGRLRSGTLNVPGIVGLAAALELCLAEMTAEAQRLRGLRQRLYAGLAARLAGVGLNGPALDPPELRLPGNLNLSFQGVEGETLLLQMPDVALSSGSASPRAAWNPATCSRPWDCRTKRFAAACASAWAASIRPKKWISSSPGPSKRSSGCGRWAGDRRDCPSSTRGSRPRVRRGSPDPEFGAGLSTPPRRGPKVSKARETFAPRCGSVRDRPQHGGKQQPTLRVPSATPCSISADGARRVPAATRRGGCPDKPAVIE